MIVDILIVVFIVSALTRGREIGFVRQFCSTIGFVGGLFLGTLIEPHVVSLTHNATLLVVITLVTTLGCALLLLTAGDFIGLRLKHQAIRFGINHHDNNLGSAISIIILLISIWLIAAVVNALPFQGLQKQVDTSHIIKGLNGALPNASKFIAGLNNLIDPNSFPQVFIGDEPIPRGDFTLPSLGDLQTAVNNDKTSVVKVAGQGCGGIVEGSGFKVGPQVIVTNAHVVAGISKPYVEDVAGTHAATVIWFNPDLDLAVLHVENLAGSSLYFVEGTVPIDTPAAILGYPGGGAFSAGPASVQDTFTASGRNIYGKENTKRDVYEVRGTIKEGNSGGPLINKDGDVIGVIFAESTTYDGVGYALTAAQVVKQINLATKANAATSTGSCAD